MPVMGGIPDTPVPIADIDLLPHSGEPPKEAWINPAGGSMGREPKGWTDPVIPERVTMPWLMRALEVRGSSPRAFPVSVAIQT